MMLAMYRNALISAPRPLQTGHTKGFLAGSGGKNGCLMQHVSPPRQQQAILCYRAGWSVILDHDELLGRRLIVGLRQVHRTDSCAGQAVRIPCEVIVDSH